MYLIRCGRIQRTSLEAGTLFDLKTEALIDELTEKRTYHVGLL